MHTELESWAEAVRMLPKRLLMPWAPAVPVPRIRVARILTLMMGVWLLMIGVVLVFLVDSIGEYPTGWFVGWLGLSVLAVSMGCLIRRNRSKRFAMTSNVRTAYRQYSARMFLGLAFAETPALIGFMISVAVNSMLPYLLGIAAALVLMFSVGPTANDVRGMQGWLDEYENPFDLGAALMEVPGANEGGRGPLPPGMSGRCEQVGRNLDESIRTALETDRIIDITTVGRMSGKQRRVEIWFHELDGAIYITGTPGCRDWYANLLAEPRFVFHLKESVEVDIEALATPVICLGERRRVLGVITERVEATAPLDDWVARSPLVEVTFPG